MSRFPPIADASRISAVDGDGGDEGGGGGGYAPKELSEYGTRLPSLASPDMSHMSRLDTPEDDYDDNEASMQVDAELLKYWEVRQNATHHPPVGSF